MWISKAEYSKLKDISEVNRLKEQVRSLKDELADLQTRKKMETREIEHLVKIKEEKLNIEHEKKRVELTAEYQKKEMEMQTDYHGKIMKAIETARVEQKDVYTEIMKRLPNVNVQLGDLGDKK